MTFHEVLKRTEKFVTDNSPTILAAVAVTGTVTTAYLAGRASFRAAEVLRADEERRAMTNQETATNRDRVQLLWKLYMPAVTTGTFTCAAIVGANRIGTRRAAAMAAAFSLSERALDEYKEKVVETLGKNKEQKVRDSIAQDRVTNKPPVDGQIIMTGGGEVLFMDSISGRYFVSDMESVKKAMNDVNYQINNDFYASLTDFYNKLGLAGTSISDDLGWNSEQLLDLTFSTTMSEDERPCIVVDFRVAPMRNYFRVH